jgi:PIN domain nuclease of toxin-antitoxin system
MRLKLHWKTWLRKLLEECGWECLPLDLETFAEAFSLPETFHGDPADRLLVATARLHRLRLVSADGRMRAYPHVACLW